MIDGEGKGERGERGKGGKGGKGGRGKGRDKIEGSRTNDQWSVG